MAADALAVGDDFESWTGIGSLHLQGDPPGRWCDRQAAASSLVGRVPCYLTPACSAPTRNSRASQRTRAITSGQPWLVDIGPGLALRCRAGSVVALDSAFHARNPGHIGATLDRTPTDNTGK